ncbi:hypothetical protein KMI_01g01650 [Encephalitozoon hellem]|nr:hypothetical protein KMI_01g01650 [Encephalitozoon hellem]
MGGRRKLFDIRSLFGQDATPEHDSEEDEVYRAIEEKRRRKRAGPVERILSQEDVLILEKMDIEEVVPRSLRSMESVEEGVEDSEPAQDNDRWKIHVLRDLLRKNRLNVDARIRLSRLLEEEEGAEVLLEGRDIKDMVLWKEIIERCYVPEMVDEALEAVDGDEDFYVRLFLKSKDVRVLKAGVRKHPRSTELRKMVFEGLEAVSEKQMFLYDSIVETKEEELVDMFTRTNPSRELAASLYKRLKAQDTYFDQLIVYLLGDGDDSWVIEDMLRLGLERVLWILRKGKRRVDLPPLILARSDVLLYLGKIEVEPMTSLPSDLWSLFVSMSAQRLHDDETFICCYNIAKQHFLDAEFIDRFFVMVPRRYFVDLMKAKELWKLFTMGKDIVCFRKAERVLEGGIREYGKEKKLFILARSKIYYAAREYHRSYLVIPGRMRTIRKYVILSQIDLERAFSELGKDLFSYKHWLLYAELAEKKGMDAQEIYEECMARYPENFKVAVGYIRYLKGRDMEKGLEVSARLTKRFGCEEWLWFERFVMSRKLGKISLPILYNSRKHVKSELIDSEIRYYENKEVPEGNKYFGYQVYKRVRKKECNVNGMCRDCITRMKGYYRERIMREQDNGDNYILYCCASGEVDEEIRRMVEFFDPRGGDYWARVRNVVDLAKRFEAGCKMIDFDFLR